MKTITISLAGLLGWVVIGAVVAAATGSLNVKRWLHQLFLACDQLLNVALRQKMRRGYLPAGQMLPPDLAV